METDLETDCPLRILFVEDVSTDTELAERALRKDGLTFTSARVETKDALLQALNEFRPDVVISDYAMPAFSGLQALALTLAHDPALPFILLTGAVSEETAVACMKAGATDYLLKERMARLPFAVREALEKKRARLAREEAERALLQTHANLTALITNTEDRIWAVDSEYRLIISNPLYLRGAEDWAKGAIGVGQSVLVDGLPKAVHDEWRGYYDRALKGESFGVELATHFGAPHQHIDYRFQPIRSADGSISGVVVSGRDITERKRAEAEIVRRAAQQAALNAILAAGMKGGADLDSLLNIAIDNTLKALGLEMGTIWLAPTGGRAHSFVMRGLPTEFVASAGLLSGTGQAPALESTISEDAWSSRSAFADPMRVSGINAAFTTPLLFNGKVIGGMRVASPTPRAWSSDEVALMEAVGSQLGIVIERARLYEETRQRMDELEAVSRVSGALREAGTLQQIVDTLLDETLAILGTDSGGILLHDPVSKQLRSAAMRGWFKRLGAYGLWSNEGIAGATFVSAQAALSRDFRSDPRSNAAARDQFPEGWGGACVPLRTSEEAVGVLYASVQLPREIGSQELRLLNTLAEIGGNAIHRTRLHEQTERQLVEAEALRDVERAVASSFDLSLTLGLVTKHAAQLLGADASAILVLNAHTNDLEYAAWSGIRSRALARTRLGLTSSYAGRVAMERCMFSVGDLPHEVEPSLWPPFYADEGFVAYFAVPIIAKGALKGVLEVLHRARLDADPHRQDLLASLAGQAAIAIDNNSLFDGLQRSNTELTVAYEATIEGWSRAMDLRDRETEGHTQRVTEMTVRLAGMVGVPESALVHVRRGALLHDIGKLGVPDQILLKPGRLTEEEWAIMRGHPLLAYELLSPITYLNPALDIPYCHHEKWDGTGYPRQLKGEEIPLSARIFAVADVWDALTSDRPYRPAWPKEKALAHIQAGSGSHFDPRILDVFLAIKEEWGRGVAG